ncbi:Tyrocidine synthase 3 [Pirellulimonas nuda]|uniref:Tyrocidine synthase 3 n=1 Tax=Pirellulimonas nuda TaxID=2528009 RepID=A0A518D5Y0_9BACT|nr:non-ribosomal peptide synthetase [Pirellulimonas nuda]QDU86875.1 Tyrocidine synthase 3 [Pirellulimonas nuda]
MERLCHAPVEPPRIDVPAVDGHWGMRSLVDVARWRGQAAADRIAFRFLIDGQRETRDLSFAELDSRARIVAAELAARGASGEPVLIVLEPGLDYVAALVGCFYAGAIAVPVYPPDPFRIARTLPRLQAIVQNAQCRLLIGSSLTLGPASGVVRGLCTGGAIEIDMLDRAAGQTFEPVKIDPSKTALLQYTSGTTAAPRGVAISMEGLMYNLRSLEQLLDVPDAVALQWLPPYHDLGLIGGVLLPLFAGRQMVLMSPLDFMRSPANWLRAISHFGATSTAAPNFGYELCLRKVTDADCEGLDLSRLQVAVSGAEPVRADTLRRFTERFAPYGFREEAFVPAYGMAEATLMISVAGHGAPPLVRQVDADALSEGRIEPATDASTTRELVGCGPPAPGVEVRIVDPETHRETRGVGEIWVRSPGVASGYWRNPEATAAAFGAQLRGGPAGGSAEGYLRTGDLGAMCDGELLVTGRRKELLILAGRNFYPHDLELAIQESDPAFKPDGGAVVSAAVFSAAGRGHQEGLIVYHEVQRPKRQDLAALCQRARAVLFEETGVEPLGVVLLAVGDIPKTSSGKTQRAACRQAHLRGTLSPLHQWWADSGDHAGAATSETLASPATETEAWLAACWRELLGVEHVGRESGFIALGGQSLQAIEMLSRVLDRTGVVLPMAELIASPTLAGVAAAIDRAAAAGPTAPPRKATQAERAAELPVTAAQQRFLLLDQLGVAPGGANLPVAVRLYGRLDLDRLEDALTRLVARHEALRIGFSLTADRWTQRLATPARVRVELLEPSDLTSDPVRWALDQPFVWRPFDLATPPLLRAAVAPLRSEDQVLLLVLHHAVGDGASLRALLSDLSKLYRGIELPDVDYQWFDAAVAGEPEVDSAYWRARLAEAPAAIDLPLERGRAESLDEVARVEVELPAELTRSVDRFAASRSATAFSVYLAGLHGLLARYTRDQTIVIGAAAAGRDHPAWRDTAGCFMQTAPVAARVAGERSFAALLAEVQGAFANDVANSRGQWDAIVEAAGVERVADRLPLTQAFFLYDELTLPAGQTGDQFGGLRAENPATDYRGLAVYDVTLVVEPGAAGRRARLVYDPNRLPTALAEGMARGYRELLEHVTRQPDAALAELPPPGPDARAQLLSLAAPAAADPTPIEPLAALQRWAAERPEAAAVSCGDHLLSYAELLDRSDRLAAGLRTRGVQRGDRVVLLAERSIDTLTAMLAVWKAGAAYVPLDPSHPPARHAAAIANCGAVGVLTDAATLEHASQLHGSCWTIDRLLEESSTCATAGASSRDARHDENDPAYLIYTSGSTGEPKGVVVPHLAVANLLAAFAEEFELTADDRVLASTTVAFDISLLELMLPLTVGATVEIAGDATTADPGPLAEAALSEAITLVQGTPSTYRTLLDAGWRPHARQRVVCGGEALAADLAEKLTGAPAGLWNVYGPTETTVWSTAARLTDLAGGVPIGRPIARTACYVLDAVGRLAPEGVWGELAIGGAGVALGYWNRPELSAERFPLNPFTAAPDARMYLTGDQVRWRPDGLLEFRGRGDNQVKVRGHRVELGEIEAALSSEPTIAEAAVVAVGSCGAADALAAYCVPAAGATLDASQLRTSLARRLPEYMIPTAFVTLDRLPRSGAGKVDRRALPGLSADRLALSREHTPPRTPVEAALAAWWRELLQLDRVGVHDSLFELGGHSLIAMQLGVRVRETLGVELPIREAYRQSTIAAWAELIVTAQLEQAEDLESILNEIESKG